MWNSIFGSFYYTFIYCVRFYNSKITEIERLYWEKHSLKAAAATKTTTAHEQQQQKRLKVKQQKNLNLTLYFFLRACLSYKTRQNNNEKKQ